MTNGGGTATQRPRRRRTLIVLGAVIVLGLALTPFAWHEALNMVRGPDSSTPACSWPAHIQDANSVQDGLIRGYLQAIANRSTTELQQPCL